MFAETVLPWLTKAANRNLRGAPDAAGMLEQLAGRVLLIQVTGLASAKPAIRVAVHEGELAVTAGAADDRADAVVTGTPLALFESVVAGSNAGGAITVAGNAECAEHFAQLLRHAVPDPEAGLAGLVGETTAFRLTNFALDARDGLLDAGDGWLERGGIYLTRTARGTPAASELAQFCADVDGLANDVARLGARVARLRATRRIPV